MIYIYIFVSFCFSACLICLRIPMLGRACLVLHICAHTQFIITKSPTFKKNIWHILMNCAHFLLIVLNLYIENWPMKRVAIHSHLMDDLKLGWKHPATFILIVEWKLVTLTRPNEVKNLKRRLMPHARQIYRGMDRIKEDGQDGG